MRAITFLGFVVCRVRDAEVGWVKMIMAVGVVACVSVRGGVRVSVCVCVCVCVERGGKAAMGARLTRLGVVGEGGEGSFI